MTLRMVDPRTPGAVPDRTRPSSSGTVTSTDDASIRRSSSLACSSASTREPIARKAWAPRGPGGSSPRRYSRRAAVSRGVPARQRLSTRSPIAQFCRPSSSTGDRVVWVVLADSGADVQPLPEEPADRVLEEPQEIFEVHGSVVGGGRERRRHEGRHCRPRPVGGASSRKARPDRRRTNGLFPAGPAGSCGGRTAAAGGARRRVPGRAHRRPARRPSRRRRPAVRRAARTAGPRRRCVGRRRCRR